MRRLRAVLVLLLTIVMAGATSITFAVAQDSTPETTAHDFPLVPDPALCTNEPRDPDELLNLWFPAEGSPVADDAMMGEMPTEVTIPVGSPADEATADAVTTTVYGLFSCFAAGDFARALAYFTDDLALLYGPGPDESREDAAMFLQATPMAEEGADPGVILAVTDVMMLDDGRVGAFVVDSSAEGTFTVYAIFEEQEDGTYLVDEVIYFDFSEE